MSGDAIELRDLPRGIRVVAASVAAASGWRAFFCGHDEVGKWPRDGAAAVDAVEVIASMRAMTATHRAAHRLYFSSPFGVVGPHYDRVAAGADASTVVSSAPSWVANAGVITEDDTHRLEPNERIWAREYAAIPQADVASVFRLGDIETAMIERPYETTLAEEHGRVLVMDASRGGDAWPFLVARWTVEETPLDPAAIGSAPDGSAWCLGVAPHIDRAWSALENRTVETAYRQTVRGDWYPAELALASARQHVLEVEQIGEVPNASDTAGSVGFLASIARQSRRRGWGTERITRCIHDGYEGGAMNALLRQVGLTPIEAKWTQKTKELGVSRLERTLRDRAIRLPRDEKLRRQLCEYSERISRGGGVTYGGRGVHDDSAQCVVTLAMADVFGVVPGSPNRPDNRRFEIET